MSNGVTQTSFRIDKDLFKSFQKACIDREVNQTEGVEQALRAWLSGGTYRASDDPAVAIREYPRHMVAFMDAMYEVFLDPVKSAYLWAAVAEQKERFEGKTKKAPKKQVG